MEHCRERYGPRFTYRQIGQPPFVFLADRGDIKTLFKVSPDILHPGEGAQTIEPVVGPRSFMLSDEEEHLQARKSILPAFHSDAVRGHTALVRQVVQQETARWPRDTPIALHPRLREMTLRIVLRTIFTSSTDERLATLHDRLLRTLDVTGSAVLSEPQLRHGPGHGVWRRFLLARAEADELILALIEERRETDDLLARLAVDHDTDGRPIPPGSLRDNIMSIVLAGHETTSSQLAWAFQLLAYHPDVQARLAEEIIRGDSQEYLTATIHEVLRHRPVFLFAIPRVVKRTFELGGFAYRPPTRLLACIYLVHHDPEIYPQPHEFRPERFLEGPPGPAHTWLPWGGGRKRCPGLHLAMLEMQIVLEAVLSHVTVHPIARQMEHPRWRSVIVTPHAGSRVILRCRAPRRRRAPLNQPATSGAELPHRASANDGQSNPTV